MDDIIHTGETVVEMQERVVEVMRQRGETARDHYKHLKQRAECSIDEILAAQQDMLLAISDYGRALRVLEHMKGLQAVLDAAEDMSKEEE